MEQINPTHPAMPTVLLVQGTPADAQLVQLAMVEGDLSVRVVTAHSQAQALSQLNATERPGLILLDPELSDGSGYDFLTRIKTHSILRHIPVIILTDSTFWDDRVRAMQLGAIDYWLKPTSFERYIDMMRRLRRYLHPLDARPPKAS
jgi:CheY-like chemotaxis protein